MPPHRGALCGPRLALASLWLALAAGRHHRLPHCSDEPERQTPDLSCGGHKVTSLRLCLGVAELHRASCAELANASFVQEVVRGIGLAAKQADTSLYGTEKKYAVSAGRLGIEMGMYQLPPQIAPAVVALGRHRVGSYVEVGIWSAWTTTFVSHYLQRVNSGGLRGFAVDINFGRVSGGTRALLSRVNVTLKHAVNDAAELASPSNWWDACFIDASHAYSDVRRDFVTYQDRCGAMMFHDVTDHGNFHQPQNGGGVPLFWQHLVDSVDGSRTREFTAQADAQRAVLGIGILAPNARGSGAPDRPLPAWNETSYTAMSEPERSALWERLQGQRESVRARHPGAAA